MEQMTEEELREALAESNLGILGLARGDRAYAFPLFAGYRDGVFYFHSHPGEKDTFIHATEEACLTIVRAVTQDDWYSVMAFGHVHQIHDPDERALAQDALAELPHPPELGTTESGQPVRSAENVSYWKLTPHRLTGRKSAHAPAGGERPVGAPDVL